MDKEKLNQGRQRQHTRERQQLLPQQTRHAHGEGRKFSQALCSVDSLCLACPQPFLLPSKGCTFSPRSPTYRQTLQTHAGHAGERAGLSLPGPSHLQGLTLSPGVSCSPAATLQSQGTCPEAFPLSSVLQQLCRHLYGR